MDQNVAKLGENIYPILEKKLITVSEKETQDMIDKALNEGRVKEMMNQRDALVRDLNRYKKLRKRWKRVDTSLKVGGIITIGLTGITAAVAGVVAPPLVIPIIAPAVPIVLGVLSGTESIILGGVVMGLTQRKKKFYLDKCKIIQSHLDKVYYYTEKCKEDGIITYQELDGFRKIISDYRMDVEGLKNPEIDIERLRKEVARESKSFLKKELKEEMRENLRSQLPSSRQHHSNVDGTLPRPGTKILE
jgi:hypothetical protein